MTKTKKKDTGLSYFGFPISERWHVAIRVIYVFAFLGAGVMLGLSAINFAADFLVLSLLFGEQAPSIFDMQTFVSLVFWIVLVVILGVSKLQLKGKTKRYNLMIGLTSAIASTATFFVFLLVIQM